MKNFTRLIICAVLALAPACAALAVEKPILQDQNGNTVANRTMLLSSDKLVLAVEGEGLTIHYGIGKTVSEAEDDYFERHVYTEPISLAGIELDSYKSFRIVFDATDGTDESDATYTQVYIFDDPTSLVTASVADIKALTATTNVTYNIGADEGMVVIESANYRSAYAAAAPNVYLWNGQNGLKLKGGYISNAANVVDGTVQWFIENETDAIGHLVTGVIRGTYVATSTGAGVITANQQTLATQAHTARLTVGEAKTVEPLEVTVGDLLNPERDYSMAYVKIKGTLVAVGSSYVGLQVGEGDDAQTINLIDDEYYVQATTGQPLANYVKDEANGLLGTTGTFTGIIAVSNGYRPSPIHANWFVADDPTTGIQNVQTEQPGSAVVYNLQGQKVDAARKGLYITGGKKFIVK